MHFAAVIILVLMLDVSDGGHACGIRDSQGMIEALDLPIVMVGACR